MAGENPELYVLTPGSTACPADVTGDQAVDVDDLVAMILAWGPCPKPPASCPANIVDDGTSADQVDVDDLVAVILNWGSCK